MKNRTEIITDQEDQILIRLKEIKSMQIEVDTMQKFVASLRNMGNEEISKPSTEESSSGNVAVNYPGYPLSGSLIEKFNYLEDQTLKVWTKKEMTQLIEQIEGKKATRTLKNSDQKIHYYLQKHELINLKYNSSSKCSFFTTRREWIEQNEGVTHLLPQHEPEEIKLASLTQEQRKSENIIWKGIK